MKTGLKKVTFFIAAVSLITAAMPFYKSPAFGQDYNNSIPLPEIEFDGSVLKELNPSAEPTKVYAPIKLIPPSSIDRSAEQPYSPSLVVGHGSVKKDPEFTAKNIAQTPPAPKIVKPVEPVQPPGTRPNAISSRAAGQVSKPVDLSPDIDKHPQKIVETAKPAAVTERLPEKVEIQKIDPPAAPATSLPIANVPTPDIPLPPVKPKIVEATDITAPPKMLEEVKNIKAPVSKAVAFPVTTTKNTIGEFNPATENSAPTPAAPVQTQAKTTKALNQAMNDQAVNDQALTPMPDAEADLKQDHPEEIYTNVPLPKPRPNVAMASKDFVEKARRVYQDTYTVVSRDGDSMPAVKGAKIAAEPLAPTRLSVADIASDPLASRLVAMSPDDVAEALNSITPSSGESARRVATNLNAVSQPRIVRENGNWFSRNKEPKENKEANKGSDEIASIATETTTLPGLPANGHYTIAFKDGETDLPMTALGGIDYSVVSALKADTDARVQIIAWSGASDGKETTARRTSLSRALAVRSYLIGKGIDPTRMDVRAMGIQQDSKAAPDLVDVIMVSAKKS